MRRISIIKASVCIGLVSLLATAAYGQTEFRMGGSVADAMAGNNIIVGSAGGNVTVILIVTDTDAAGLGPVRSFQFALTCDATPLRGAAGTVTHDLQGTTACGVYQPFVPGNPDECVAGFCVDGGNACFVDFQCPGIPDIPLFNPSPCIDTTNPDHIFAAVGGGVAGVNSGPCPGGLPRGGGATFEGSDAQPCGPGQACYVMELSYAISLDAVGDHGLTAQNPDMGMGGDSFVHAEPLANIPFAWFDPGAIIRIPAGACCGGNGCIADGINEAQCDALGGSFSAGAVCNTQCLYGDITSVFGLCEPDCTGEESDIDFDDILCALNGFASFEDCPCADVFGGIATPCVPNGIIDFDDVLAVLDAHTGNPTCPCG